MGELVAGRRTFHQSTHSSSGRKPRAATVWRLKPAVKLEGLGGRNGHSAHLVPVCELCAQASEENLQNRASRQLSS